MVVRVIVAEDDLKVGAYLKKIIEEVPDFKVVSITHNGSDAIRQAKILKPHAVFLDIKMPEMGGIEAAKQLVKIQPGINLIFATACSDFAIEAFELYSFDYILKPFNEKRIKDTLNRLKGKLGNTYRMDSQENIMIKGEAGWIIINPNEILFIESQRHRLCIKTEKAQYLSRGEINNLEEKLKYRGFFRSHRSYLVNLFKIKEIVTLDRTFGIILLSGDKVLLSREREKSLRAKFDII